MPSYRKTTWQDPIEVCILYAILHLIERESNGKRREDQELNSHLSPMYVQIICVYIYIKVCKVLASDAMTCNDNAIVIPEAFPNNLEGPASGLGTLGIG
jgi:hypothetical protein